MSKPIILPFRLILMQKNTKIVLSLIGGFLFSGIALYFTFRNIPVGELTQYLKTVNYWWVLPSVTIGMVSFVVRVIRWQLLLEPVKKTAFWSAFHPLMIGFMLNCLLPARAGEIARPAIYSKEEKVPFTKVLATVGAERVFDSLILLLLLVIVFLSIDINPDVNLTFGDYHINKATLETIGLTTLKLALILVCGIVLVIVHKTRDLIKQVIMNLTKLVFFASRDFQRKMEEKVCRKLVHIIDNIAGGFELLKSPKKVLSCFLLSLVVWLLAAASYYVMGLGCPGIEIGYLEMIAAMVILCFFISLPSAPGFWGLWEAGGVFALLILGAPAKEAAGFTLTNHVFQMLPPIIVGIVSAFVIGVNVFHVASDGDEMTRDVTGKTAEDRVSEQE